MSPSRFTRLKVATGYSSLLAVLLFSLLFIHREMEALSVVDDQQELKTDSLLLLLHEKDENAIQILRVLSRANDSLLSVKDIENIIAEQQDSAVSPRLHIQKKEVVKKDTLIFKPKKRGFFKRLTEVFSPSTKDTTLRVKTSREVASDTIIESPRPADSLHLKIREASFRKQQNREKDIRRNSARYQQLNSELTAQMDTLLKTYEREVLERSQKEAMLQQSVRYRSTRMIAGIAVGGVLLSAFFLILIWRDITRSNRYRRQLEEANRRAAELLEAREKMMLTITHDFKAPLGSIMGYTDLLSRLTGSEREQFYLSNMKSSSSHLLKLVNDLLDFHKLDLNKAEINRLPFNPMQLFEEIHTSFGPLAATKGLALECRIAPELSGRFMSDPLRIRQIVNNLMSNAIKFTKQGCVQLLADYDHSILTIEVVDTGKGMGVDDRKRIFQEFTRLPGAQGEAGFGLGLSIVHKLIELLEGSIDVQSVLNKGSRFVVTLPLYPVGDSFVCSSRAQSADAACPVTVSPATQLRVLLIDDDQIQLALTTAMLSGQSMEVECCEKMEELTEKLRNSHFDVLLTDIQMPEINGFELLKQLRASCIPQAATIPVIAVTARSDMDERSLQEYGFSGCLHKPFSVRELTVLLNKLSFPLLQADAPLAKKPDGAGRNNGLDLSALTAFSGEDSDAAGSILHSFIEETRKDQARMKNALAGHNACEIAEVAHKLLPLLTLIGDSKTLPLLQELEEQRGQTCTAKTREVAALALVRIENVVVEAEKHLSSQPFTK